MPLPRPVRFAASHEGGGRAARGNLSQTSRCRERVSRESSPSPGRPTLPRNARARGRSGLSRRWRTQSRAPRTATKARRSLQAPRLDGRLEVTQGTVSAESATAQQGTRFQPGGCCGRNALDSCCSLACVSLCGQQHRRCVVVGETRLCLREAGEEKHRASLSSSEKRSEGRASLFAFSRLSHTLERRCGETCGYIEVRLFLRLVYVSSLFITIGGVLTPCAAPV